MIPPNGTTSSYRNQARRGLQPNTNGTGPSSRGNAPSSIHRPNFGSSLLNSSNPKLSPAKSQNSPGQGPTSFAATTAANNHYPVHSYNAAVSKGTGASPHSHHSSQMKNGKLEVHTSQYGRNSQLNSQAGIKRPSINTKQVSNYSAASGLSSAPVGRSDSGGPASTGYGLASANPNPSQITLGPKSARPPVGGLPQTPTGGPMSSNLSGYNSQFSGRDGILQPNGHHRSLKKDHGPGIQLKPTIARDARIARHPLRYTWVCWFMHRPPGEKIANYAEAIKRVAAFSSIEDFWAVFSHMKRPSDLPTISDYHLFRQGVRPVWEDEVNASGGKWIVRLRKGFATRYWESLVLAVIGDLFGDNICGIVLSIRNSEDILSLWNQDASNGPLNLRIRDTLRQVLSLPVDTVVEYKRHASAIKDQSSFRNTDVFR